MHNSTLNKITQKNLIIISFPSRVLSKLKTRLNLKLGCQTRAFTSLNVCKNSSFELSLITNVGLKVEKAQKLANKHEHFE